MEKQKQRLVDQFFKNSAEIVKVNLEDFKGQRYVDIRVWHLANPAENGSEVATYKGICLNVDFLSRLIQALEKAQREMPEFLHEKPQERRSPEGRA